MTLGTVCLDQPHCLQNCLCAGHIPQRLWCILTWLNHTAAADLSVHVHVHDANLSFRHIPKLRSIVWRSSDHGGYWSAVSSLSCRRSWVWDDQSFVTWSIIKLEVGLTRCNDKDGNGPNHFTNSSLKRCYTVGWSYAFMLFLLKSNLTL